MDPARKRRIRLVVALTAAVLLAGALVYTSFSASSEARTPEPAARRAPTPGQTYQLTGKVADGSVARGTATLTFRVRDRNGTRLGAGPLHRRRARPVPRGPRGHRRRAQGRAARFVGEKDSLVTKCPSKFTEPRPRAGLTC